MLVTPLTNEAGGKVLFSCPRGHSLIGSQEASCQPSSQWDIKESMMLLYPSCYIKYRSLWFVLKSIEGKIQQKKQTYGETILVCSFYVYICVKIFPIRLGININRQDEV